MHVFSYAMLWAGTESSPNTTLRPAGLLFAAG